MSDTQPRTANRFSQRADSVGRKAAGVVALCLLLAGTPAAAQVHAFYSEALSAGTTAFEAGDYAAAAERLRIASFGMLDSPDLLAEALVRLGLAQAALAQRDDFVATFDRIDRLGDHFGAYERADLPPAVRSRFESQVVQWVPDSVLAQSRTFAELHRRQELERLQMMLPAARAAELESIVAARPGDRSWQLMLATARIESGTGESAIDALEAMPSDGPETRRVACLLGRAYLQAGRCDSVLSQAPPAVQSCDVRRLPTPELTQYLDCLTAADRWAEAASLVVSLPAERRTARPFSKWEKQIVRALEPGFEAQVLPPFEEVAGRHAPVDPGPKVPAKVAAAPKEPPAAELEALRQRSSAAGSVAELRAVAAAAEELAARFPGAAEPHYIAGKAAYRASDWRLAADHLQATGGPPDDRPELLFYLSISLYEMGDRAAAAKALRRALPGLENTDIVERYRHEILD
jgi:tetratricopeptide (TPR) repeat protein